MLTFQPTDFKILSHQIPELSTSASVVKTVVDSKKKLWTVRLIKKDTIQALGLQQTLQLNFDTLKKIDHYAFPHHFLKHQEVLSTFHSYAIFTEPYRETLEQHIKKKRLSEQEAMLIFDQILKIVFSLYLQHQLCFSLRTSNVVLSAGFWKVSTLIYGVEANQNPSCEFVVKKQFRPPECYYYKQFSWTDLQAILVWNLGCILMEMLLGRHILSFEDSDISTLINPEYYHISEQYLDLMKGFSFQLQENLDSMLHKDPKDRVKLVQLFQNKFLSPQVCKVYQKRKETTSTDPNSNRLLQIEGITPCSQMPHSSNLTTLDITLWPQAQSNIPENKLSNEEISSENLIVEEDQSELLSSTISFGSSQEDFLQTFAEMNSICQHKEEAPKNPVYLYAETKYMCKVCFERKSTMINQVCGHLDVCLECLRTMGQGDVRKELSCPMCRRKGLYHTYVHPIYS